MKKPTYSYKRCPETGWWRITRDGKFFQDGLVVYSRVAEAREAVKAWRELK